MQSSSASVARMWGKQRMAYVARPGLIKERGKAVRREYGAYKVFPP